MHLSGIMCFSSSIICLLIVSSHGSVAPGHRTEEGRSSDTTSINNSTEHQRDQQSSGFRNTLNSSYQKNYQDSSTPEEQVLHHSTNASSKISKSTSHLLRKKRSADVADYLNKVSTQVSEKSNSADPSQQPVHQESHPSIPSKKKERNSHHHPNSSHNESETSDHPQPESEAGFQVSGIAENNAHNSDTHDEYIHKHDDHDHHDHGHHDHDHEYDHGHEHHHEHEHEHSNGEGLHDFHEPKDFTVNKHHQVSPKTSRHISGSVWLYASLAVVIISLCGLLSVAVIPIMQKWFYQTLLQFLVGLAVGSLSGDGLLHLMPHAILGGEESHDHNNHNHSSVSLESIEKTAIWRGLAALGGVFLFFVAERLLGALTAHRRKTKEAKLSRHTKNMIPVMQREDGANNGNVGEKLAQPKKNSYDHIREKDEKETIQMLQTESSPSRKGSVQSTHEVGFHGRSSFSLEPEMSVSYRPDSESSVIVSDHHGHSHGHTHDIPHSVSAVAWMVIMGDGLHNFCDGLAIGAAFASSDADGVSTTVAVFCHELPHELGDFAMLLKTGMKVKQALFYNGLSSILCFIGMVIGVCLGNVNSATNWVFAGTAGMFLYIALVDMLPELTSVSESGKAAVSVLAVQVVGITIGICVMLLIALYEHKLSAIVS